MSIRDIIETADTRGWYSAGAFASKTDGRFIATFDPEHVALMEAERVAARELIECAFRGKQGETSYVDRLHTWAAAGVALDAYRKTYGYGD